MLTEAFTLVIQLPPLAFGPALPRGPFELPRALVCEVQELGRIQAAPQPSRLAAFNARLDPGLLKLAPERFLVNRPVDILLLLATAYAGRATWDTTPWTDRAWQATGAVTPVLVPPMAPPAWSTPRR
jgi:hypothetical protein